MMKLDDDSTSELAPQATDEAKQAAAKKKQMIEIVVLIILLPIFFYLLMSTFFRPPRRQPALPAPAASAASTPSTPPAVMAAQNPSMPPAAVTGAEKPAAKEEVKDWGDNPFAPRQTRAGTAPREAGALTLGGIVLEAGGKPCAIISDRVVSVGDTISGYTVKDIQRQGVFLMDESGKELVLEA